MEDEAEYLLRHPSESERADGGIMRSTTLGRVRAYWLGSVVCTGGFLFGYDSGIVVELQLLINVW